MTVQQQIAAALRGAGFDGRSGPLVRFLGGDVPGAAQDALVLPVSEVSVAAGGLSAAELSIFVRSFHDACQGGMPSLVAVPPIGLFALGRCLDDLEALEERAKSPDAASVSQLVTDARRPLVERQPVPLTDRNGVVAGRVAVVTGGAQGFGAEIVRALVAAGAIVVVADLNHDGAARFAAQINGQAGRSVADSVAVDVSDEASVAAMFDHVCRRIGGVDLLVSNAGVLKAGSVKELSLDDFEFVARVNYRGFFLCTKHASIVMAAQFQAAGLTASPTDPAYLTDIIQINSKSGLEGSNRNGAYAGAKFGSIGLVQSFAMELVTDGIKVNAICPGNFFEGPLWSDPDRGLFVQYLKAGKVPGATSVEDVKRFYEQKVPMGRGCRGEDVARAIFYAVEQRYETGQAIPVTGGQVMLR